MSSFRRRESASENKRKNGRRDKSEFDTRHIEHKIRKMITKDKSDKYKRIEFEEI